MIVPSSSIPAEHRSFIQNGGSFLRSIHARLLLPLILGSAGCYQYVPAQSAGLPQGAEVRVSLEEPSSFDLLSLTARNVGLIEGVVVSSDDPLVLAANQLHAGGAVFPGSFYTVSVERANIASVERRAVSSWRTGLFGLAGVVGAFLAWESFGGGASGSSGSGGGGGR